MEISTFHFTHFPRSYWKLLQWDRRWDDSDRTKGGDQDQEMFPGGTLREWEAQFWGQKTLLCYLMRYWVPFLSQDTVAAADLYSQRLEIASRRVGS